ncbi:glycosyltransferase involved in cell wall biosynthesis [Breznakibacter xylanolyticus]|uniref:Glycosyltransferase involved in cell wall biosynthesis n=2 Tax=Breznakibacter xylanolyticus TaxID=990 RepID=A0A2W7N4I2_9BACT|nr:glycosyltransferase involved in cell wall biosynthesis [Breznakibacter xylanolyticus]
MLSCLHSLYDDRIYWKESVSLQKYGYKVVHVGVSDQEMDLITPEGIRVIGIPRRKPSRFRLWRILNEQIFSTKKSILNKLLAVASSLQSDVYHFHDLQIIRIVPQLKKLPHSPYIIYDVHEPYPFLIASQKGNLLQRCCNYLYSIFIDYYEQHQSQFCNAIIATEPIVANRFSRVIRPALVHIVFNYSDLSRCDVSQKCYDFIYCGGITINRGIFDMIEAIHALHLSGVHATLLILGKFHESDTQCIVLKRISDLSLNQFVTYIPAVDYQQVPQYYAQARFGLCLFRRTKENETIMPIKIFEYIKMGLPVIGSHFGHIAKITTAHQTGLLVDPSDAVGVAQQMKRLLNDVDMQDQFFRNCSIASEKLNWLQSEMTLLDIYSRLA